MTDDWRSRCKDCWYTCEKIEDCIFPKDSGVSEMKMSYKYIRFECLEPEDHKRWFCFNKSRGEPIAKIIFYEPWRQWVMQTYSGMVFNNTCLRDIADFLSQLNREYPE